MTPLQAAQAIIDGRLTGAKHTEDVSRALLRACAEFQLIVSLSPEMPMGVCQPTLRAFLAEMEGKV